MLRRIFVADNIEMQRQCRLIYNLLFQEILTVQKKSLILRSANKPNIENYSNETEY